MLALIFRPFSTMNSKSAPLAWKRVAIHQDNLTGELYLPVLPPSARAAKIESSEVPPALVILPDDSGISDLRERAYAEWFAARGMICLVVDPFSPRGLTRCADNPTRLGIQEIIRDAYTAYDLLVVQHNVKSAGVLGVGRGGLAALHLGMAHVPGVARSTGRFAFVVALSPTTHIQLRRPRPTGAPFLLLAAGQDEAAALRQLDEYAASIRAAAPDQVVVMRRLDRAGPAWEKAGDPVFHPDAVLFPDSTYYLEEDGSYTDADATRTWLPGEAEAVMGRRGRRLGGGDDQLFVRVCREIDAFIREHHHDTKSGRDTLQILNRLEKRDSLLLRMARCRDLEELFALVSTTIGNLPDTALARIWLLETPNDACEQCCLIRHCTDQSRCLHLAASAGRSLAGDLEWRSLDGDFRRIPLGVHKVGTIAVTGLPFHVRDVTPDMTWVADPEWIRREKIRTLLGQPLMHQGEVIGVFLVFSRRDHGNRVMDSMRLMADHMAVKIAHARAFAELSRLKRRLEIENNWLQENMADSRFLPGLIGESPSLRRVKEQILQVAPTEVLVLITGESGTGKELAVNELHARSRAAKGPLIKVNCPTIPHELFESEFFGHARGAFTGANTNHMGFFEAAENGTLFLDEIGEIPLNQQSKLLRALQEHEYRRVGEERVRTFHTRIVAATNRVPEPWSQRACCGKTCSTD